MAPVNLRVWAIPNSPPTSLFLTIKPVAIPLSSYPARDKVFLKSSLPSPAILIPIHGHVASLPPTFAIQMRIALPDVLIAPAFYYHLLLSTLLWNHALRSHTSLPNLNQLLYVARLQHYLSLLLWLALV